LAALYSCSFAAYVNPAYVFADWHIFVISQAINFAVAAFTIFALHKMTWINQAASESRPLHHSIGVRNG
jgi:hypothetical protein